MSWEKLGRILYIDNENDWAISHSSVPFAHKLSESLIRIYFSVRNNVNQSQTAFQDFDICKMKTLNNFPKFPALEKGKSGTFDEAGVSSSCICSELGFVYYLGWNLSRRVPFNNQIGVSKFNGSTFKRFMDEPILGRCSNEPNTFGYPWVMKVKDTFYMWYDTNPRWSEELDGYRFELRLATSSNGISWNKSYQNCFELKKNERAFARPCVLYEDGIFKMWYSIDIGGKYSIGYAESLDAKSWTRKDDESGLSASDFGWDSKQVAYPCVFKCLGSKYMLYNGNGYGKTGIGLAKYIE